MLGRVFTVVPAAGSGTRMGLGYSKAFADLEGVTLLGRTLLALFKSPFIDQVAVAMRDDEIDICEREVISKAGLSGRVMVIRGGEERQASVLNLLSEVPPDRDLVLIHDGARPFVNPSLIREVLETALEWGAATTGLELTDTIKESVDGGRTVHSTHDRTRLFRAQTPQAFQKDLILGAHRRARKEGWQATDDASLVERLGGVVRIVRGDAWNMKLTTRQDLEMARWIIRSGFYPNKEVV